MGVNLLPDSDRLDRVSGPCIRHCLTVAHSRHEGAVGLVLLACDPRLNRLLRLVVRSVEQGGSNKDERLPFPGPFVHGYSVLLHTRRHALLAPSLRSEEHTSELQSLMRNSYAVFCLKKKTISQYKTP